MPLVSYIRKSLRFWYYASLSTCRQNFEKNWSHRENLGESVGIKLSRDLTDKNINFSTLATSNIRFAIFWRRESINEIGPNGGKKFMITEEKLGKIQLSDEASSLPQPKFYIRGSMVIAIHHNVELCKQYFLQECLLVIRKSSNRFSVFAFMEKDHCGN